MKLSKTGAKSRLTPSALAFFASFTTLTKIFVVSLLFGDQSVDWPSALSALTRIFAFSLGAGLLAFGLAPMLQRHLAALLFGLLLGLMGAATYIRIAA
nr:putative integron gene cassette protein [uncultured bacterium]